jgi:cytochrome b subunit of formate dehydrogenase
MTRRSAHHLPRRPWATALAVLLALAPTAALSEEPGVATASVDAGAPARRGPGTKLDRDCLVCHAGIGEEDAPKLDVEVYRASVHAEEGCAGCHADVTDADKKHEKEDQDLAPVDCASCHEGAGTKWKASVHGVAPKDKDKEQGTCDRCHGTHDILKVKDPMSQVHPVRQYETCGQCHGLERAAAGHTLQVPPAYQAVLVDAGQAVVANLMKQGVLVSAGCADCHSAHDVRRRSDPTSWLYPANVVGTCKKCHEEQQRDYEASAHGQAALKPGFQWVVGPDGEVEGANDPKADKPTQPPVCSTCHVIHARPVPPKSARFRLDVVKECGACHLRLMETYSQSYHGKATILGDSSVAKCSDCHTAHQNFPASDPRSSVAPANRLKTCQTCHKNATEGFEAFWPHADHRDRENYPVVYWLFMAMSGLLISVFSFFGIHTLLWMIRDAIEAFRERGKPKHRPTGGPFIRRFGPAEMMTHLFVVISFLGLSATGAPLKFPDTAWAKAFFVLLGGVRAAGWWHRLFAVMTFGYFGFHLFQMVKRLRLRWREGKLKKAVLGPDSLVPSLGDLKDIFNNMRYFVGLGPRPTFERWTYWEKFDYLAVFWGVAIIGTSGLVLWFPNFFAHAVPGWVVNVALVIHSDEALLAMGFIYAVHFFNGHLRRAKFPMDPVIFTGTVPEEEYREERGREWARIVEEGRVEELKATGPTPTYFKWIRVLGIAAYIIGLVILGFIVHGFFFAGH